jgi:hypothetical protein
MDPAERAELGSILHHLVPAVRASAGVERGSYLSLMERAAHLHLSLVPKYESELRGADYLAQHPTLTCSFGAAEAMSQKVRAALGRS